MTPRPRLIALSALALAVAAAPQGAPMAQPQGGGAFYAAVIAAPATAPRLAAGGVAWTCGGTSCVAPRGTARPLRICRELKRKTGTITQFAANGEPLSGEELARCNA